jgi:hypothetical protein
MFEDVRDFSLLKDSFSGERPSLLAMNRVRYHTPCLQYYDHRTDICGEQPRRVDVNSARRRRREVPLALAKGRRMLLAQALIAPRSYARAPASRHHTSQSKEFVRESVRNPGLHFCIASLHCFRKRERQSRIA